MKKLISSMLLITFIFQFNTINVLAEELNKNLEINISENEGKENLESDDTSIINDEKNIEESKDEVQVISDVINTEGSIINSVKVNKTSFVPGEELILSIEVTDNTGIDTIMANMWLGNESLYNEKFTYNNVTKKYEYKLLITEEMKYKKLRLVQLEVIYNTNNTVFVDNYNNKYLEDILITDIYGNIDDTKPVLESATINKDKFNIGDTLEITVNATDNLSGIEAIVANIYFGNECEYVRLVEKEVKGVYKGTLSITESMKLKEIYVYYLSMVDKAGNTSYIYDNELNLSAKVSNENGIFDEEAPIVKNINLSSNTVKVGDTLEITIDAEDSLSGIKNIQYKYGYTNYWSSSYIYKDENNQYKIQIPISEDMLYKEIKLMEIVLYDNSGNSKVMDESELTNYSAIVTDENGQVDGEDPKINSISINESSLIPGESLVISVDATDDTKIKKVTANISIGDEYLDDIEFIYNESTKKYEYTIPITKEMKYKYIKLFRVDVVDNANKEVSAYNYSNEYIKDIVITDESGMLDTEDPVLKSSTLNKEILKVGDNLEIIIDATDDLSGISRINGTLCIGNDWRTIEFTKSETDGLYRYILPITKEMKLKKIYCDSIEIYDNAGNSNHMYTEGMNLSAKVVDENGKFDEESPILNNINFNKNKIKVGETLEITFDVSDNLSGVDYINITYTIGDYWDNRNIYKNENNEFKYSILITENMVYKDLVFSHINIYDNTGNNTRLSEEYLSNYSVSVGDINGKFDLEKPKFNSITVNKNLVKPGENLIISIDATDDLGIKSVTANINIGYETLYDVPFNYNNITKKYEYTIPIQAYMKYKLIKIGNIAIRDKADKITSIYNYANDYIEDIFITNENGLIDITAPELIKFNISTKSPKVGDTVELSVEATDNLSGIDHVYMDIHIENYVNTLTDVELVYDKATNKYKYSFKILEDMKYKNILFNIDIIDKAGNTGRYEDDSLGLGDITIADSNGKIDSYSPILNNISISKDKVKVGDKIDIIVDAIDKESGIESVSAWYSDFNGNNDRVYFEYDNTIKKYKGSIIATKDVLYRGYIIESIEIRDKADNRRLKIFDNPYIVYVTDELGKIDTDLPIIKSISVDKNEVKSGDKIKISVEALDITTGINKVIYTYSIDSDYITKSIELIYNSVTKKYEGEITINDSMKGKVISAESIEVTDNVGNQTIKAYWELDELNVTVLGEEVEGADKEGPKFLGITIDKKLVKVGEKVKLSVKASDNLSGVKEVSLYFNNTNLELEYNELSKAFEGYITLDKYDAYKTYKLNRIGLVDNEYNYTNVYEDTFGDISFLVADAEGKIDNTKPVLTGYSIYKNTFTWSETPIIKVNFTDDLTGVRNVAIKAKNSSGTKTYYGSKSLYGEKKNILYVPIYELSNSLVNEKIIIEEITLIDNAGNEAIYTSKEKDFSTLTFNKGNYIETDKINIKVNNIHEDDEYLIGNTSLANTGIRIYNNYGKIQIVEEALTDASGNFKIKLDPNYSNESYMIEAYNTKTNEVLGYKSININKSVDIIKDGVVDIKDLAEAAIHYGEEIELGGKSTIIFKEDTKYKSDINNDNYIDIYDLILISKRMSI